MTAVMIVVLLFVALGLAAARWGADTRDGRDWQPLDIPRPTSPSAPTRPW